MKRTMKLISFLVLILMAVPMFVKAEEKEPIVVTCEGNREFKVGTNRTCTVEINGVSTYSTIQMILGDGLDIQNADISSDMATVENRGDGLYLITKKESTTEPIRLQLYLELDKDTTIDETGVELLLTKQVEQILLGDANFDGAIDANDKEIFENYHTVVDINNPKLRIAVDMDGNGIFNENDMKLLEDTINLSIGKNYVYKNLDSSVQAVSSGVTTFKVDCTPAKEKEPPKEENVDVPDTASNLSTFVYIGGALCMAFGVYLIVQSRKTVNE